MIERVLRFPSHSLLVSSTQRVLSSFILVLRNLIINYLVTLTATGSPYNLRLSHYELQ